MHNFVNMLNTIELHALNGCIAWSELYVSKAIIKNNHELEERIGDRISVGYLSQ